MAGTLSGTPSVDLDDVPFETPVVLLSSFGRSLESAVGAKGAVCFREGSYAGVELVRTADAAVGIRALHSGLHLSVRGGGDCFFDARTVGDTEKFTLKATTSGELYFVSHSGEGDRWLLSDRLGSVRCSTSNLSGFEFIWHVASPWSSVSDARAVKTRVVVGARQARAGKERRQFIMRLVELGKSMNEMDDILERMYEETGDEDEEHEESEEESKEGGNEDRVAEPARKKRAIR